MSKKIVWMNFDFHLNLVYYHHFKLDFLYKLLKSWTKNDAFWSWFNIIQNYSEKNPYFLGFYPDSFNNEFCIKKKITDFNWKEILSNKSVCIFRFYGALFQIDHTILANFILITVLSGFFTTAILLVSSPKKKHKSRNLNKITLK